MLIQPMAPAAWDTEADAAREEFVQQHRRLSPNRRRSRRNIAAHTLAHVA
ncbi:hypothetical protein [Streptomyces lydicus]|nr:hypothetical protein [Streptomyces lydicus]MDC7335229.1 hypothetical protein [Streptomyces lydicus]